MNPLDVENWREVMRHDRHRAAIDAFETLDVQKILTEADRAEFAAIYADLRSADMAVIEAAERDLTAWLQDIGERARAEQARQGRRSGGRKSGASRRAETAPRDQRIIEQAAAGVTTAMLAKRHGVSESQIRRIKKSAHELSACVRASPR